MSFGTKLVKEIDPPAISKMGPKLFNGSKFARVPKGDGSVASKDLVPNDWPIYV